MSSSTEYNASFAELYDHVAMYVNRADARFYLEEAQTAAEQAEPGVTPVLELGCGTGRVLLPIARAGIGIAGLDFSDAMLEKCREALRREPEDVRERVRLVQSRMTDFRLDQKFQLITIPFRPFQHLLTVEDQLACLKCARQHLAPHGRLVFDAFNPKPEALHDSAWRELREDTPWTKLPDGRSFRRLSRVAAVHRAEQVNDIEFVFEVVEADGRAERRIEQFPMRYFFRFELEHLLARAGFRVAALYGNFERVPFAGDSPEMIFAAEIGPAS